MTHHFVLANLGQLSRSHGLKLGRDCCVRGGGGERVASVTPRSMGEGGEEEEEEEG